TTGILNDSLDKRKYNDSTTQKMARELDTLRQKKERVDSTYKALRARITKDSSQLMALKNGFSNPSDTLKDKKLPSAGKLKSFHIGTKGITYDDYTMSGIPVKGASIEMEDSKRLLYGVAIGRTLSQDFTMQPAYSKNILAGFAQLGNPETGA